MKKLGVGIALVLASMAVVVLSFQHYNVTTGAAVAGSVGDLYGGWVLLLIGVIGATMLYSKNKR
ncbi:hypothetical protein KY316_00955 [Candidatus Woesearchaeota archaeon]|nr:hypothetical protein [Candidatus Woesearchaeota archaeon]